jgi:hypothetical protein
LSDRHILNERSPWHQEESRLVSNIAAEQQPKQVVSQETHQIASWLITENPSKENHRFGVTIFR